MRGSPCQPPAFLNIRKIGTRLTAKNLVVVVVVVVVDVDVAARIYPSFTCSIYTCRRRRRWEQRGNRGNNGHRYRETEWQEGGKRFFRFQLGVESCRLGPTKKKTTTTGTGPSKGEILEHKRNADFCVVVRPPLLTTVVSVRTLEPRYQTSPPLSLRRIIWTTTCSQLVVAAEPVWPDLAKLRHFGEILSVLGNFSSGYLFIGKILNRHWQYLL